MNGFYTMEGLPLRNEAVVIDGGFPRQIEVETTGTALGDAQWLLTRLEDGVFHNEEDGDDQLVASLRHIINLLEQDKKS